MKPVLWTFLIICNASFYYCFNSQHFLFYFHLHPFLVFSYLPSFVLFIFILWAPVLIYKIMVLIPFFPIILDDFSFLIAIHLPIVLLFSHQSLLFVLKHFLSLLSLFLSFLFIHSYSHIFMSLSAHLSFLDLCFAAVPFPKHQFSLLLPKLTQYVLCIFFLHSLPSHPY